MALTDKLTAIADAIRGKTGKTDGLTLDQMPGEIAGIQAGGGGVEPTASYLVVGGEIRRTIAAYPFKPKYENETIVWKITGENKPDVGSLTCYAYLVHITNGSPNASEMVQGTALTAPWTSSFIRARRYDEFTLDEEGNVVPPEGSAWAGVGANNTCTIYEIPLPFGLEV